MRLRTWRRLNMHAPQWITRSYSFRSSSREIATADVGDLDVRSEFLRSKFGIFPGRCPPKGARGYRLPRSEPLIFQSFRLTAMRPFTNSSMSPLYAAKEHRKGRQSAGRWLCIIDLFEALGICNDQIRRPPQCGERPAMPSAVHATAVHRLSSNSRSVCT